MKRVFPIAIAVAAMSFPLFGQAGDPGLPRATLFKQKLSTDRQISHALNRLTFGPRPGDLEEVQRTGVARWMEQQLHPDRIPENPVLEKRLTPLKSLSMPVAEVISTYSPERNMAPMMMMAEPPFAVINRLPQSVRSRIMNGTAEERTAALDAMDPELRGKVLGALPDNVAEFTPSIRTRLPRRARRCRKRDRLRFESAIRN